MRKTINISGLLIALGLVLFMLSGCTIGSAGIQLGPFSSNNSGPGGGYSRPSNFPLGHLGVEIVSPQSGEVFFWESSFVVTGVIWRQDMNVFEYPWYGPTWYVDSGKIGESYYFYNQSGYEVWVEFIFDGRIIGPGQHNISLQARDERDGGDFPVSDSITIILN